MLSLRRKGGVVSGTRDAAAKQQVGAKDRLCSWQSLMAGLKQG